MRIKTERSIMRLSLIFLGICFFSNYTYSQDYHEIKFENADQLGSAWYGGDLRTPGSERNIGSGESVLIDTSMQIDSFSLYIGGFNNVDSAKLVLDVRNDNGVIIASDTILIKTSFGSDWITWTNLNLSVLKGTILRFTSYVLNGGVTGFRGSIRGDVGENYPFGKRQDRRATRLEGPPPFDMISWDLWFDSSWDMWFWAQGTTLTPREQDSLALVDLYNNTDGPNWTDNTNWLSAELIDNWFGVTVLDNRVVDLNLFNNNLTGVIPYSIGNLTSLNQLNLGRNNLSGTIPTEIGNLTSLTQLLLDHNQLSGTILTEIGNLTDLQWLFLNSNQLTGTVPAVIGDLTSLTQLGLGINQLTGTIPTEIGNLTGLTHVWLSSNQLSGTIPVEIGNLTSLTQLYFHNNQLTGAIPAEIGNLTNLTVIYLSQNQLTGTIPAEIGNLTNLLHLYLNINQLAGTIPSEIGNLTKMLTIQLRNNQLTGAIPSEIWDMTSLTNLDLNGNQLTGTLPAELGNLINLTGLHLGFNELMGTIPVEIGNLTKLKYLNLAEVGLNGIIPEGIADMADLLQLYLNGNHFTQMPDISTLTKLGYLTLQYNNFTFEDIEPNMDVASTTFSYAPQDSVGSALDTTLAEGASFSLSTIVGGSANQYQWLLDGNLISGAEDSTYIINSFTEADTGRYTCEITNTIVTDLTLTSRPIQLSLDVGTDIIFERTGLPKDYDLYANYPNPFNPTTTIKYDLPKTGMITLTLYNNLGQKVRELINENKAAGVHRYNLNAENLPSGTYFYRIEAGGFSAVRRMLLIK